MADLRRLRCFFLSFFCPRFCPLLSPGLFLLFQLKIPERQARLTRPILRCTLKVTQLASKSCASDFHRLLPCLNRKAGAGTGREALKEANKYFVDVKLSRAGVYLHVNSITRKICGKRSPMYEVPRIFCMLPSSPSPRLDLSARSSCFFSPTVVISITCVPRDSIFLILLSRQKKGVMSTRCYRPILFC